MSTDDSNSSGTPAGGAPGVVNDTVHPYDPDNSSSPLININVTNVTKLSASNYFTWSLQLRSLLQGYNLAAFLDLAHAVSATTTENGIDKLLFSAILRSISSSCQALIARSATTSDAWDILVATYERSSRGHVKQIKENLRHFTKGTNSIDEYMYFFKVKADELALLDKPLDHEDLVDLILNGLADEYKPVKDVINARDVPISFVELHERLLNHEYALLSTFPIASVLPVTAHNTQARSQGSSRSSWTPNPRPQHDTSASRPRKPSGYQGEGSRLGGTSHNRTT
ncbi:PREDICTED: uncharacterized protein LOC109116120 [Tarenaya hassleriana]|uniref:uncharacterized protein LOC109116120 n=1 Tax=Tarenaya hassleriana TaxID=28532 RepID=UPI0008FD493E|nr:PREDICTED: uncharacterized protein LOC109116120 [Tarenaya hassleriana]